MSFGLRSTLFWLFVASNAAFALHPHFPKRVEFALGFAPDAPRLAVWHITVTFDRDGFEAVPVGGSWHLGNAHFETPVALRCGEVPIPEGRYRLLARKRSAEAWELLLDPRGRPFEPEPSEEAIALPTTFREVASVEPHLRIDLHPSGDEKRPAIGLRVAFDRYRAEADLVADRPSDSAGGDGDG